MKISYKKISTFIFALAFFLQSFGDIQYLWEGFSLLSKRNIQNPDCTVCNLHNFAYTRNN